jgi:hypothetical protein
MQKRISQKSLKKPAATTRLNQKLRYHELKRRIKKSLEAFKNGAAKLKVIQTALLATTATVKQAGLYLKLNLSATLRFMSAFKTRMMDMVPHGLQIVNFVTKKGKKMMLLLVIVASLVLNLFLLGTISGQLSTRTQVYSYGSIQIQTVGLAAYSDATCTTTASDISWGTLTPGASREYILYIKNDGTTSLNLFLDTENWNPTNAANYIMLNWNYNGQPLAQNQVIQVKLTLTVSQNISGINNFSFEIILRGTDAT